ncbi:HNH endonuclease [Mycoplasma feriruminatoris]|uniref:HNH domain-containing protein n=1 Tax=Mycoplasma feriruminatoris TaxID=1179777 RepID=A0A654IIE0_9MOLU|nr:hypothetical protein MF5295_00562 [Mycoplasma feriruminatoris]VZS00279.1 hypothetical protein MF5583_00524 [Mycoplasma feriruminatoris]VZS00379.1 hypothetical protein MF5582_00567 [Mycoplasma feriruminatoris]
MKVSDVLQSDNINQLFFIFFNLSNSRKENTFLVKSSYKESKLADYKLNDSVYESNNELMSKYTQINLKYRSFKHYKLIENDLNMDREVFLHNIYKNIQKIRLTIDNETFERSLYLGLFAFRGSPDFKTNFYSVDLLKCNNFTSHWEDIISLLISSPGLSQLNLNFRELQPQYVNNKSKRNTQIRINLRWFFDKYFDDLKEVNIYKASILSNKKEIINKLKVKDKFSNAFFERLNYYKHKILSQYKDQDYLQLTKKQIADMREELNFTINEGSSIGRNPEIVGIARIILPDFCFACKDIYEIQNRTFIHRQTGKLYLEIHHVIPFAHDKNGDILENMVKLCPACHKALSKNRAQEPYQKELIGNIISNSKQVDSYLENIITNNEDKVNFVYERLR